MLTLDDIREKYYKSSASASSVARQASFAGIAVIWIFKTEVESQIFIPQSFVNPLFLFTASLALDLFQYASQSLIWSIFNRSMETKYGVEYSKMVVVPVWVNWPAILFFWGKILLVVVAYVLLMSEVADKVQILPK